MNQIEKIKNSLIEAKKAYYNGVAIISDEEFDFLENELKKLDPNNEYFSIVGTSQIEGEKIQHSVPMLSQDKATTMEEIEKWQKNALKNFNIKGYAIEPKIDGLSCSIVYENGNIKYIATRGNGKEGSNISHIGKYIQDIPLQISILEKVEIRGELYIPKNSNFFNNSEYTSRRNCAAAIIRPDRKETTGLNELRFVAYQMINQKEFSELNTVLTELKRIWNIGFNNIVPYYTTWNNNGIALVFKEYKEHLRDTWEYETDGLVIIVENKALHEQIDANYTVSHHHFYSIALKAEAQEKETVLKNIRWQISRHGNLIPVAEFEPVELVGAMISNASLYNYERMEEFHFHKGDKIIISRRGDVIPKIIKNLTPHNETSQELIPHFCPVCKVNTIIVDKHILCQNSDCIGRRTQKILFWVQQCKMKDISEKTIETLVNNNLIKDITDLYSLTSQQLQGIEGFGEKTIYNIINEIKQTKRMKISQFIGRLGIPLVQEKSVKNLGIETLSDFLCFKDTTFIAGQNLIQWKKENMDLIEELLSIISIELETKQQGEKKMRVCMTGSDPWKKGRNELIKEIEKKGYEFSNSVTKDTNILICEDVNGNSGKLQKARKDGIKLMSYEEFFI
jgi:DNA ligase (NAD+)